MKTQHTIIALSIGAALLSLGIVGGRMSVTQHQAANTSAAAPEKKVLYWFDPMKPDAHFDQPGQSPFMDMALVPKYAGDATESAGVKINAQTLQNTGMRQAKVERQMVSLSMDATGILAFNERDVSIEQARSNGFVERVWPLAPGDIIAAGQPLAEVLIPEWTAAQQEYLAVRASGDANLISAARERLRLTGMPAGAISELEKNGKISARQTLRSTQAGVIQELSVRNGMTLTTGQTLAKINGISSVWLDVAVPEAQSAAVQIGGKADVLLAAFPGVSLNGKVTAILPTLNDASRSLKVRVELPNKDGRLRPGMSAQVKLASNSSNSALLVPTEAIIRTGKRSLVMQLNAENHFMPIEVTLGAEVGDKTIVLNGLSEGQKVVASGQFLIDSEANLAGIKTKLLDEKSATSNAIALDEADATIKAIDGQQVTLAHGHFKVVGMTAMTMAYPVARIDILKGLKVGDKVRAGVRQSDDGLIIEQLIKQGVQP
ncbi:efflux RND transporter periplasmic adaptor subunit [Deefgea sp. CFH1-16]|uniref:efflux RND transporter periplasmic adaptor subunit n=1 Tax=Deefgea sp. CFH1-16 TaxID=2675457 RepID=UPI0015F39479|nr:efflux RND transporter periplasmic adaptor subunit [Deefgea sp. CFH1-16]MBM5573358.1 efflux RND transporter periplasmic adaptor subunit [Deefgea sp. CFH1-16]